MIYTITIYNRRANHYCIYKRKGLLRTIMINDIEYPFSYNKTVGEHFELVKIMNKIYDIHYIIEKNTKRNRQK